MDCISFFSRLFWPGLLQLLHDFVEVVLIVVLDGLQDLRKVLLALEPEMLDELRTGQDVTGVGIGHDTFPKGGLASFGLTRMTCVFLICFHGKIPPRIIKIFRRIKKMIACVQCDKSHYYYKPALHNMSIK